MNEVFIERDCNYNLRGDVFLKRWGVNLVSYDSESRGGSRDFEKGGHSMSAAIVVWRSKFLGFRWSKKAKITLETISFWPNISFSIFKMFSIFKVQWKLAKETLSIFQNLERFYKKREKNSHTAVY